jgi:hypothetical protein
LVTDIKTVLNYGKYSCQVISDSPDWEGKEGETLFRYQANGTGWFYYQYFWVNSGWSFLRWVGSSNALVVDNNSITDAMIATSGLTYSGINPSSNICRHVTGYYTGNASTTQSITGIGFKPKTITIEPLDASAMGHYTKDNSMATSYAKFHDMNVSVLEADLITLDADGFTLGDGSGGSGENPNQNTKIFAFHAWG